MTQLDAHLPSLDLEVANPAEELEFAEKLVGPQDGPQEKFLESSADIVIYGGKAGAGKTWGLLYEPLRHIMGTKEHPQGVQGFFGVIFRREAPQIRAEGGLWDESAQLYPDFGGRPLETILEWRFPGKQTMRFASLQHDKDRYKWQGAQIPYIAFDELTHFTETQFFYMLSRNRSISGVRPYVRATTNPDADSWVADLIAWWIDQDEASSTFGLPIPERSGQVRYFIRKNDRIIWADEPEELYDLLPPMPRSVNKRDLIKSLTFIAASIYDNQKLLEKNPEYLGNLMSLPFVERERLLGGNWKIRPTAGNIFNRDWWKFAPAAPAGMAWVRYWDKAATDDKEEPGAAKTAAFTAGVLVGRTRDGYFYVQHCYHAQVSPLKRERAMRAMALDDPEGTTVWVEQEPGSGGKESAQISTRTVAGFKVKIERVTGDKVGRAMPASAQVEAGNVFIVKEYHGLEWDWRGFINELHQFPEAKLKDQADSFGGAMTKIMKRKDRNIEDYPISSE